MENVLPILRSSSIVIIIPRKARLKFFQKSGRVGVAMLGGISGCGLNLDKTRRQDETRILFNIPHTD